jgi:K+-transporting ATPase A subunit
MRLLAALTSFATDNGEGLVGETDDRIITFASLGVIVFFVLVVFALATLQHFLDRRKEQRKAAELRRRVGW